VVVFVVLVLDAGALNALACALAITLFVDAVSAVIAVCNAAAFPLVAVLQFAVNAACVFAAVSASRARLKVVALRTSRQLVAAVIFARREVAVLVAVAQVLRVEFLAALVAVLAMRVCRKLLCRIAPILLESMVL
jgi:hypothetical protein